MLAEVRDQAPAAPHRRDRINRLQAAAAALPQVELPTTHFFADGMYARVVERPAGTVIVGRVHRREHFYIVSKGRVAVDSGDGADPVVYESGSVLVSQPGTKRAVYALEDAVCMTVHRVDGMRDLDEIEAVLIEGEDAPRLFDSSNKLLAGAPQ